MKTTVKTITVPDKFTIIANIHSWEWGYQDDVPNMKAWFTCKDTGRSFELPVNKDFIAELDAGANQTIEMEIKILDRN